MEDYRSFEINKIADTPFPLGVSLTKDGMHFSFVTRGRDIRVLIYRRGSSKPEAAIEFPEENRWGDVVYLTLKGDNWGLYEYEYEADGVTVPDPYGRNFTNRDIWGDLSQIGLPMRTRFLTGTFDWEGDRPLEQPFEDMVVYHLHIRGFTMHASSKVKERGTYFGAAEKIPYLKELGITAVELMPVLEFEEVMVPSYEKGDPYGKPEPTGKLNYWGYTPSFLFAPKAAYASGKDKNPEQEFKGFVKACHRAGIEVILEIYYSEQKVSFTDLIHCLRFWVMEYHVDGFHFVGGALPKEAASDPFLSRTKLFARDWGHSLDGSECHLAEYHDGFLVDMRRYLKGDEDQLGRLVYHLTHKPEKGAVIHYMTNTNGFTMMDLVSYDRKHNEENGEGNRDGNSYNHSWNCGTEGTTRSKKIIALRHKQIRNAFTMMFLCQGVPLILSGDEFGNSQKGNNNAYCQDNEVSWLNWNLLKRNHDIYDYLKALIRFRKEHRVFHMKKPLRGMDYLSYGLPDISYHGKEAWRTDFETYGRSLGVLYCGQYTKDEDGTGDDFFYTAYNMDWEYSDFALPNLPKGKSWYLSVDTEKGIVHQSGKEEKLEDQKGCKVPPRCIWILIGR